jgi:hypothetical protein
MLLYFHVRRLLVSLYVFICRFVCVASILWFYWKRILGNFMKICWETPILLKSVQKFRVVYLKTWVCFSVFGDISFQRSWFRWFFKPKRYKYYANASQYHVYHTLPSCIKMTSGGTHNICTYYISTQTFLWLIGIFVTRWRDTGWNAAWEEIYHLICTRHHRIDIATWRSVAVQHKYLCCLPQHAAYWYRLLTALRSRKTHLPSSVCECTEQGAEQK